jgi:hypothetical protein
MSIRDGDQHLRDAGIVLPCAKQFGWLGTPLHTCDRPYGHTGAHATDDGLFRGGRDAEDEARTVTVLTRLVKGAAA